MMKKQFFRVKQLVDQTVSRAEKSEVFTEDVQSAERHIDLLKQSCSTTSKKMVGLISGNEGTPEEKRVKKIPETVLGNAMIETGVPLGEKSIMRELLTECGKLQVNLGHELFAHEIEIEKQILQPLNQVEIEANNISKTRRNLNKLILDMDSARTRYQTAQKQASSGGSATKMDGIKEEMEEAQLKVDMSRDSLAADIYTLLAKESEFAKVILQFAESQRNYHRAALRVLEQHIPQLEAKWNDHIQKPVFGYDLEEHLHVTERTIANPIEICVCTLYETGMDEEGLFRIAGGASKNRKFRAALDACIADVGFALALHDVHIVAGTLKSYLRELPDPLLSHALYDEWIATVRSNDQESRLNAMRDVINKMSEARRCNVRYLMRFFQELSRHQEYNKMSPQNLAIVLAPSLIWSPANSGDVLSLNMTLANTHASIVEHLITFADWFFPGEVDYYVTYSRILPMTTSFICPTSPQLSSNGDEAVHRVEERTHRRLGSNESVIGLSASNASDISLKAESPRPTTRKKNKPAPVPPSLSGSTVSLTSAPVVPGAAGVAPSAAPTLAPSAAPTLAPPAASVGQKSPMMAKTPDKEEHAVGVVERANGTDKPTLPPTGPDSKRFGHLEKKPALAPRPSVNMHAERPSSVQMMNAIGFEALEMEWKNKASKLSSACNSRMDEDIVDAKSQAAQKRSSAQENPTPHPNAIAVLSMNPPAPLERTKFDFDKPKPNIPERPPSFTKLQGNSVASPISADVGDVRAGGVLERIHSFSGKKEANLNSSPLTLNSPDYPGIQFADSEDIPTPPPYANSGRPVPLARDSVSSVDAASDSVKPERPPKPERLSQPTNAIESNNNKQEVSNEDDGSVFVAGAASTTLPRPRPQPPLPPAKPRMSSSGQGAPCNPIESTDF